MKFCISCGSELQENVEFCTNCGANVNQMSASQGSGSDTQQPNPGAQNTQFKDTLNKVKNLNYFNFVKETAVNPTATTDGTDYNGWIQLGLIALFTALTIYNILNGLLKSFLGPIGGLVGSFSPEVSAIKSLVNSISIRLFFLTLITFALFVFGAYFIKKYAYKNKNIGVTSFVNQFSTLLTPNLIIVAAATLLALISSENTIKYALILVGISFLLVLLAYVYYLYNNVTIGGIDHFNVLLIGNIIVFAIIAIAIYLQVQSLISALENIQEMNRYIDPGSIFRGLF